MKIVKKVLIVVGILLALTASFFGGYFTRNLTDPDLVSLKFILDEYKKYYLEESDDYLSIMGNSILDEYSKYYTAEEFELLQKVAKGSRAGIGIQIVGLNVSGVIGNSPAERAGIEVDGNIKEIKKSLSDEYIAVNNLSELSGILSEIGENTDFSLKIEYGGEVKEFTLKKEEYQETYVYYSDNGGSYRFNGTTKIEFNKYSDVPIANFGDDTGYIKYKSFSGTSSDIRGSAKQVETALGQFKKSGRKNLIFDLRSNGGGYLDIACNIASHLICKPDGEEPIMAFSEDKNGKKSNFYSSKVDYGTYGFSRIIFLADENTASASEALIGAAVTYDTNNIVSVVLARSIDNKGNEVYKTYGKGVMQITHENRGVGDAIRLTTAYIKWPNGVCIHGSGITSSLLGAKCVEAEYGEGDYVLNAALKIIKNEV